MTDRSTERRTFRRPPEEARIAGRVPPHDLDAEAMVLSAAMLTESARDSALELLRPEQFYSTANQLIFDAIRDLSLEASNDGSIAVDIGTVASRLRDRQQLNKAGGTRYLVQIIDATPAVSHVEAHCKIVSEKHRLREVIRLAHTMAAEGYGDVGELQEWLDQQEQALHDIARAQVSSPTVPIGDALTEAFAALRAAAERGDRIGGIATGFIDLDQKTAGLHPGNLRIIAARPGMGKTALFCNMAVNVASPKLDEAGGYLEFGHGALLFSMEMPREQIAMRMACADARVDLHRLLSGHVSNEEWGRLTSAAAYLSTLPIHVDDTPALNLLEMRARVRRVQSALAHESCKGCGAGSPADADCKHCGGTGVYPIKLGIVGADYLQLMKHPSRKHRNREQEISEIARGLKALAKEQRVPVVALSQLNRGVETRGGKDKRPMLADLRESGEIEAAADEIIFVYRDEYYNRDKTDEKGIAELIIGKQRNGPTGTVKTRFTGSYTRFDNLAPGDYASTDEDEYA